MSRLLNSSKSFPYQLLLRILVQPLPGQMMTTGLIFILANNCRFDLEGIEMTSIKHKHLA